MGEVFQRTRWTLTLWYSAVMGLILLMAAGLFLGVVYLGQRQGVDRTLTTLVGSLTGAKEADHLAEQNFTVAKLIHKDIQEDLQRLATDDMFVRFYNNQGRLVWEQGEGEGVPQGLPTLGYTTIMGTEERYRQLTIKIPAGTLQISFSLEEADELWMAVVTGLAVALPLLQGIVGLAAWFLAGRAMVPIQRAYTNLQQFTADASHELRTPIATVLTTAQSAVRSDQLTPTQIQAKFQAIGETAQRMGRLTEDLLWLARADSGEQSIKPLLTKVSLTQLMTDLYEELAPQALAKNLTFSHRLPTAELMVWGQEEQLYRLFINLISNAIKYTPPGGQVALHLVQVGDWAIAQVRDTGLGIAAEHLPHVFDRFYRVDAARTMGGGFGLGLAIAQKISLSHQGKLTARSTLGQGSVFEVSLPIQR